jgi:hypothetical protein
MGKARFVARSQARSSRQCYCALCGSPRKLRYERHLSSRHYIQILMLNGLMIYFSWNWLGFKGAFALPLIWAAFEWTHKALYRKDVKCPYCGFDPAWYKKDVKLARKKVEDFLKQNPDSPVLVRARKLNEIHHNSVSQ